jgi:hypothetical protein
MRRLWKRAMALITIGRLLRQIEKRDLLARLATGKGHPETLGDTRAALEALLSILRRKKI